MAHLRRFDGAPFDLASARSGRHALQGDLDNILAKALAFDAKDRYPSAALLPDDLRRYLADQPVTARPATLALRLGNFVRRKRLGTALGGLLIVAAAVGVSATVLQSRRADLQRIAALLARDNSEAASYFLSSLLSQAADQPFTARSLLARAAHMIESQYRSDPQRHARLLLLVIDQYIAMSDAGGAAKLLPPARQAAQSTGNGLHNWGLVLANAGQTLDAADKLYQSLALSRQLGRDEPWPTAPQLGLLLARLGRETAALRLLDDAERAAAVGQANPFVQARISKLRADALQHLGKFERAAPVLAAARQGYDLALTVPHLQFASLFLAEAQQALVKGELARAQGVLDHGAASFNRLQTLSSVGLSGLLLRAQLARLGGAWAQADQWLSQALAMAGQLSDGFVHTGLRGEVLLEQARLAQAQGQAEAARHSARAALAQFEASLGPQAPLTAAARALVSM